MHAPEEDLLPVAEVCCPSCGESFFVVVPPVAECPTELDYDCEVCCRPMVIVVDADGLAEARGTGDGLGA